MIIFRFSKLNGAEFISHLDTMRHVSKTLLRAKIPVEYSKGFNPHMQVYLSPPIFVGLKSQSEYCLVETDEDATSFVERFNSVSPKGIKCISAFSVNKKYKIAGLINSATYHVFGVKPFDVGEILNKDEILLTIKGIEKNVRQKILDLRFLDDGTLQCKLAFGNDVLRADLFCDFLEKNYSKPTDIIKVDAFCDGELLEDLIKRDNQN